MQMREWAERHAEELVAPLGLRWSHTVGVANRADAVGAALGVDEVNVLVAAAYLHDVGYAPALAEDRFHPLDGARHLRNLGEERLAGLVAHHGAADQEAELRGFGSQLRSFPREQSELAALLDYCDLTVGPSGESLCPADRLADVVARYGEDDFVSVALREAWPHLEETCRVVDERLATSEDGHPR